MRRLKSILSRLMQNDRFLIVLSLFLAFVFWFSIAQADNTYGTRTIVNVPVNTNLSNTELEIITDEQLTVDVVISGSVDAIAEVTADDISVSPVVGSDITAGTKTVRLSATKKSVFDGFDIDSIKPAELTLRFDKTQKVTKTVTAKAKGASASADAGLIAEDAVLTDSAYSQITLSGPQTELDKIESVVAIADVNAELSKTAEFNATVVLLDADGKEIDDRFITKSFTETKITVRVSKIKDVPVKPTFIGAPSKAPMTVTPEQSTLTVIGEPEVVDTLEFIELEAIDMGTVTASGEFECKITDSAAVRLYGKDKDKTSLKVTIKLNNCTQKTLTVTKFKAEGVANGMTAELLTPVSITVMGPASQVKNVTASDITVVVKLSDHTTAGRYSVVATAQVSGYDGVWVVSKDYSALVELK